MVEPYSGDMLPMVARFSASGRAATPGPKNSTNLPTTPCWRSSSVTVSTRSVAVVPSGSSPVSRRPTTLGTSIGMGWPSMAASASMPPTPQPTTPRPLTIGVWESVPTSVSGKADAVAQLKTTRDRYSRLTWWQMPVFGRDDPEVARTPAGPTCRNS